MVVSLNSRLESNTEEEIACLPVRFGVAVYVWGDLGVWGSGFEDLRPLILCLGLPASALPTLGIFVYEL